MSKDKKASSGTSHHVGKGSGNDAGTTSRVPLLPLRDVIIFPHMVVPLFVGREKSINALEECVAKKSDLFLGRSATGHDREPG